MKTIGLLGGMSWESSIEYERLINELVRERLGGLHSADLVIRSYDFHEIEALQSAGDWEIAGQLLAEDAQRLEWAGAELVVLCTNTMHKVAPAIEAAISVPFLHLADATAEAVKAAGVDRVALFGTRFTMEEPFYRDRLESHGLVVDVPDPAEQEMINRVIYDELVQGRIEPDSKAQYLAVAKRMLDAGTRGVIAGCTEIELLIGPDDISGAFFPTTRIHAEAAVEAALR